LGILVDRAPDRPHQLGHFLPFVEKYRRRHRAERGIGVEAERSRLGGVPCIRSTRIPVATVVGMIADGMIASDVLADFPQLAAEDIQEALRYAAAAVDEHELPLRATR
jgi:uncharacterized protein (DUF433 family)